MNRNVSWREENKQAEAASGGFSKKRDFNNFLSY